MLCIKSITVAREFVEVISRTILLLAAKEEESEYKIIRLLQKERHNITKVQDKSKQTTHTNLKLLLAKRRIPSFALLNLVMSVM